MGQANPLRRPLLAAAVVFHASNVLLFGLSSFFLCMTGAAFLLVWPYRRELPLPHSLVEGMSEARVCRAAICRWVLALRSPSGLFELRNYKLEGRRFLMLLGLLMLGGGCAITALVLLGAPATQSVLPASTGRLGEASQSPAASRPARGGLPTEKPGPLDVRMGGRIVNFAPEVPAARDSKDDRASEQD